MKDVKIVVLLTASIDVKGMTQVAVTDSGERLREYAGAARFWARAPGIHGLVFCENSGHDLGEIRRAFEGAATPTELLQFDGQGFDRSLGKGYGELLIMSHALEHSRLLGDADLIVKVTGRYRLGQFPGFLAGLVASWPVQVTADLQRTLTWADSRVFGFTPAFFKRYLAPHQAHLDDSAGMNFEHALARAIHAALAAGERWAPLPAAPEILGRSGTDGKSYRLPWFKALRRRIYRRIFLRELAR
jgi:hypothetical protein